VVQAELAVHTIAAVGDLWTPIVAVVHTGSSAAAPSYQLWPVVGWVISAAVLGAAVALHCLLGAHLSACDRLGYVILPRLGHLLRSASLCAAV
jgi:hypothetical protein